MTRVDCILQIFAQSLKKQLNRKESVPVIADTVGSVDHALSRCTKQGRKNKQGVTTNCDKTNSHLCTSVVVQARRVNMAIREILKQEHCFD
jgi:hypothetical protein